MIGLMTFRFSRPSTKFSVVWRAICRFAYYAYPSQDIIDWRVLQFGSFDAPTLNLKYQVTQNLME